MRPTAALWMKMLEDIPYEVAENALMKVMATNRFFPTVAEIREAAALITTPELLTHAEAWSEVLKAVRKYGTYDYEKGMASLPDVVRQVVRMIGWREICLSEQPDVIRGQFRMAYEQEVARIKERALLPENVKRFMLQSSGNQLQIGGQ